MRRLNGCVGMCLILAVALRGTFARADGADEVTAENGRVRLTFGTRPVPYLKSLVQKPSGIELVSGSASLFFLRVAQTNGASATFESRQARRGTAEIAPAADGKRITLSYEGLGPSGDIRVALEGVLADAEPFVRWTLAIENPSRLSVSSVRFPCVSAVPVIGSPDDDFIVGPALPGVMIENPATNWPSGYQLSWRFPGDQSAQFCSYQDGAAGVYLASMDTEGLGRDLTVTKQNGAYLLYQEYLLDDGPVAAQWKSPYATALGVTAGTWQQTADLYKRWAVRQAWCAKTLAQRDDVPAFWKQGPCIHTCEVRTYGTNRLCNGSYYPQLEAHMRALRERIGGPIIPMLPGWENYRRWTAGAYFPLFDSPHAGDVIGRLRTDGFRPFVYLSGLFYTYKNEGRDGGDVPGWERYADSLVIDANTGKPKSYDLNESSPHDLWNRRSYQFCPAAPGTEKFFLETIDRLHAQGIDIVQLDQTTGGAGDACYSPHHGHAAGRGAYQSQAFRSLMAALRRHGNALSPEFMLTHEELHEELIPYVDAFHTREYGEHYWYRSAPGARGIPLFTYLYHEYAIAYGGEGPGVSASPNPNTVRAFAVNLVSGKTPAVSVWSNQKAMAEAQADQIEMLANHVSLLQTEAQRFLILGRMLHPLVFDAPEITLKIPAKRNGAWKTEPFVERAVLTSSWQSPEGIVGHCFVNITTQKVSVAAAFDARAAVDWGAADADLYRADGAGTPVRQPLFRGAALPHRCGLEIAPLEAAFVVMRPAPAAGVTAARP